MAFRNLLLGLAVLARVASAGSLDPTEYYENLRVGDYNNPAATYLGGGPGSFALPCVQNDVFHTQSCATATFSNTPVMSLSASVSAYGIDPANQFKASTWSEITAEVAYFYTVQGAVTGSPIPLVLDTYVSFTASGGPNTQIVGAAQTRLDGVNSAGSFVATYATSDAAHAPHQQFLYTYAIPGVQYDIALIVNGLRAYNNGYLGVEPIGTGTIFIDPILSFAPGFDSTGYSLVFNADVGNGADPSAPEPATFATLASALGLLALRRRIRRQSAA